MKFKRTNSNHEVFVSNNMFIAIYVDDLFIFEKDISKLQQLQHELKSRFRMTNLKKVSHYLRIEMNVNIQKSIIILRQTIYLKKHREIGRTRELVKWSTNRLH